MCLCPCSCLCYLSLLTFFSIPLYTLSPAHPAQYEVQKDDQSIAYPAAHGFFFDLSLTLPFIVVQI
ncbi:hypothetical protein BJY01DRAFT_184002 [Aspergillus pseudoustus]|uniref:Uncharacterized protein n=1 Tax=Aspergillus pseudoustus TaxID=1810923 RepID=A0ABR4JYA8_9EURO